MFQDRSDARLRDEMVRLQKDIHDFESRAHRQKALLEAEGRFSSSEPLYQRHTSIRQHLQSQLRDAEEEIDRRERVRARSPKFSLRGAVASWFGAPG
jgi:hypothetical protein